MERILPIEHIPEPRERKKYGGGTRFLSVHDVAEMLGCHVATVWRRIAAGDLPQPIKIGGLTRFDRGELEAVFARAKAEREAA